MKCHFSTLLLIVFALGSGLLLSCSRAYNPDIERGSGYYFEEGHPEVRISALGVLNEDDQGVIDVAADIVDGSLIFREQEGEQQASVDIEVRIAGVEGTRYSDTYTTEMTITNEQEGYVTSRELVHFRREFEVPPGDYEIEFTVLDQSSGNSTSRTTEAFIPDPAVEEINLTSVQLLGKINDPDEDQRTGFQPITTYDVSTANDSIRFVVQVTNNQAENPLAVQSRLIQFEADTSAARPMSFNNYSPSSLPYKGIDYNSTSVLDETRRVLEQSGIVLIEYRYKRPDRGNYRFEVETEGDEELFKARDFSVKGENFPSLKNPRELAAPLIYLMGEGDHEELMEIENPDSLKEAVDRFWLSNIGSMNEARHVISLYYERVEQANKQFTNFKEGWKTDAGMIYILFGPPWYVDRTLNRMQWSYSYDRADPRYNFYFERPRGRSEFFPFDNYLLQRSQNYFNLQYQQVQRWLTGQILQRNM